jgi:hypothetical protein
MKINIPSLILAGMLALNGGAYAGSIHNTATKVKNGTMNAASDIKNGSENFAQATWDESKRVARTIVDSPSIAYHVARGDRPLFTHHESMALTGHPVKVRTQNSTNHAQQPPI